MYYLSCFNIKKILLFLEKKTSSKIIHLIVMQLKFLRGTSPFSWYSQPAMNDLWVVLFSVFSREAMK